MNPDAAIAFLDFVRERHSVWEKRQKNEPQPWTDDPIIRSKKFTNVFRVLDYGSQFLVRELLDPDISGEEILFRCWVYRYTNHPPAWYAFWVEYGRFPLIQDWENGSLKDYWTDYASRGNQIFSGAYMVNGGSSARPGVPKHIVFLEDTTLEFMSRIGAFFQKDSLQDRVTYLQEIPFCSGFMSMQICTDFGYWDPSFSENDHVVLGPGALKGCKEIDPVSTAGTTFRWAVDQIREDPESPAIVVHSSQDDFYDVNVRRLSLMDIQNCLCEFSKYARYSREPKTMAGDITPYSPQHATVVPTYPVHWKKD